MPYDAEHQTLATRPVWLAKRGPRARPRRRAKSCRVAGGNDDDDARASTAPKLNQLTCPGCQGGCPGNWPDTASAPFSRWHQHERVVQRAVRQTCLFVGAAGSCLRSRCHNMVSLPMRPACDALPVCDADAEEERPSSSACNSTLAKRKASAGERRAFAEDASSPMSRTSASAGATSTGRRALSGMYLLSTFLVQHVLLASVSGQQRVNLTRRQHGRIVPAVDALDAIAEVARVSVGRMPSLKAREVGRGNSAVTLGRQGILLALGARVTVSLAVATSTA